MEVTIREETADDVLAIRRVNDEAFDQSAEGRLVDLLRANNAVLLSLVAVVDERVVGHILFSPARAGAGENELNGAGLGPMAVLPEFQRKGIGSNLIVEGINRIKQTNCRFIVVLGHPEYYPRFGFVPASKYNVRCSWEVPDEAFMILLFDEREVSGLARYREEFSSVS